MASVHPSALDRRNFLKGAAAGLVLLPHVDLVLPLDEVSLLVRRAGLDLDPGWCPSFGRIVQFHYQ